MINTTVKAARVMQMIEPDGQVRTNVKVELEGYHLCFNKEELQSLIDRIDAFDRKTHHQAIAGRLRINQRDDLED